MGRGLLVWVLLGEAVGQYVMLSLPRATSPLSCLVDGAFV